MIGTKATIKSNIYQKKIEAKITSQIVSLETPLLAPMIRRRFF